MKIWGIFEKIGKRKTEMFVAFYKTRELAIDGMEGIAAEQGTDQTDGEYPIKVVKTNDNQLMISDPPNPPVTYLLKEIEVFERSMYPLGGNREEIIKEG